MRIARVSSPTLAMTMTMLLVAEGFHPSPQPETLQGFVDSHTPFDPITIEVPEQEAVEARALLDRNGHAKWLI